MQSYDIADVRSLRFDSDAQGASPSVPSNQPTVPSAIEEDEFAKTSSSVTIPAGTRISVRTIDSIDSTRNRVGYRFEASLEEPLWMDGDVVVPKGADVYGRLDESKETGTFTGRSELKLELTGIVVDGQTVPLVTGEYEVSGKSKGASTAKELWGEPPSGASSVRLPAAGKGRPSGREQGRAWELPRKLSLRETK